MAPAPTDEIRALIRQARQDGGPAVIGRIYRGGRLTAVVLADRNPWIRRALELRKDKLLAFLQAQRPVDAIAIIDQFKDPLVEFAVHELGARVTYREEE